jgi:hypothetical protein
MYILMDSASAITRRPELLKLAAAIEPAEFGRRRMAHLGLCGQNRPTWGPSVAPVQASAASAGDATAAAATSCSVTMRPIAAGDTNFASSDLMGQRRRQFDHRHLGSAFRQ